MDTTTKFRSCVTACCLVISLGMGPFIASRVAYAAYTAVDLYPVSAPAGTSAVLNYSADGAAGGQVAGAYFLPPTPEGPANLQAAIWMSNGAFVNLRPDDLGVTTSDVLATHGSQQVGYGGLPSDVHALLWTGSADSVVDLTPTHLGITRAHAEGTNGAQQVGYGFGPSTGNSEHALLWNGSASSAVDLHPQQFNQIITRSWAVGTDGAQQVGYGQGPGAGSAGHALMWSGTAASAVDLNPSGFGVSQALGVTGQQQVGFGQPENGLSTHALLWTGSPGSALDLNPTGFNYSVAFGTSGTQQAGWGQGPVTGGRYHALLWTGSADSAIDLHGLLPARFTMSIANSIAAGGVVYGLARDSTDNQHHAIAWVPHAMLPGDAGMNGVVDSADVMALVTHFGQRGGWVNGDFDASGIVDLNDLIILSQNVNNRLDSIASNPAVIAHVPEPSAQWLLALACAAMLLGRLASSGSFGRAAATVIRA